MRRPSPCSGTSCGRRAAAPDILGRTVGLNRTLFTIVGVAAEGTSWRLSDADRLLRIAPISADPLLATDATRSQDAQQAWLFLVGRRSERADLEQVRAELGVIAAQIDRQQPGRSTTLTVRRATPMTVPLTCVVQRRERRPS